MMIREADPDDAQRIQCLYGQLVDNPDICVLPARIQEIADDPQTALLVCDIEGTPIATALVSLCRDSMFGTRPFAVVENLVVDARCRGAGVGEFLVRHIEHVCAERSCSKIMLLCAIRRTEAHRFYRRMGFHGDSKQGFVKYAGAFSGTR